MDDQIARGTTNQKTYYETVEKSQGRIEIRRYWTCWQLDWLAQSQVCVGLASMVAVECTRTIGEKTSADRRHFINGSVKTLSHIF